MDAYSPPPKTKILLALSAELQDRFRRILGRHDLTFVEHSERAMRELDSRFGMVILSVHFDESQMFTLLGDIRAHSGYRKIPILCVLGKQSRLSDVVVESLDHAVKAMRANGFLDLQHFEDDEAGNARIRRIIDYLILIDGDLQHIARTAGEGVVPLERRRRKGPV